MITLRKAEKDIELALADCNSAHDKMLEIPNQKASVENEIEWIRRVQTHYNNTVEKIENFIADARDSTRKQR